MNMRKMIAVVLSVLLALSMLAGCASGAPAKDDTRSGLTVALVVAGTFGDRSFYDSSKAGCDKLAAEGIQIKTIECKNENHTQQIYNAADAADVIVLVGWEFYDVETVAPEYPDKRFIWIDNATSAPVDNVLNITYAQLETEQFTHWRNSSAKPNMRSRSPIAKNNAVNRLFSWE